MKVSAVTFFGIAGVEHVAASPAGACFVVSHGRKYVIVDGACLFERRSLAFGNLHREFRRQSGGGHERIRREIFFFLPLAKFYCLEMWRIDSKCEPLVTDDIVDDL